MAALKALARLWRGPPESRRWVVVDVESSGLDPARDALLAIAGLALHLDPAPGRAPRLRLGDSFELLLRSESAGPDYKRNVLVHGIGLGARGQGVPPARGLAAFAAWLGGPDTPLLGYQVGFDEALIQRAARRHLQAPLPNPWVDLEPVARALDPAGRRLPLDGWLAHYGIGCLARHAAGADALATAELLQCLWPALHRRGEARLAALSAMARAGRWL